MHGGTPTGATAAAAALERIRERCGAAGIFCHRAERLLMPQARVALLESEPHFARRKFVLIVAAWFITLWHEVLVPRCLHLHCGIYEAESVCYAHFPIEHAWQVPSRIADEISWEREGMHNA
mmetsp:Transcript_75838/g.126436  ORF Transcript_75838/g.126436 Transcript_75838/m.126436 type:complete len:122 (+) Transcript_75838:1-366(+)